MNFLQYQQEAIKTLKIDDDKTKTIHYLALGLVGEIGELANLYKKTYHGQNIRGKYVDEAGDAMWYYAGLCHVIFKHEYDQNIEILAKRHWIVSPNQGFACESQLIIGKISDINFQTKRLIERYKRGLWTKAEIRTIGIFLYDLLSQLCSPHGITLEEIYQHNIDKLRKRHGETYNPEFYQSTN